jgi:hypothetical protein
MAFGYSIERYETIFEMEDDVKVSIGITFNERVVDELLFELPRDADEITLFVDEKEREVLIRDGSVVIELDGNRQIALGYKSSFYLDGEDFIYEFYPGFNVEKLLILLTIPEGVRLEKGLNEGGSIYPKPSEAITDGRRMTFVWDRESISQGEEMAVFVKLESDDHLFTIGVALALLILVLGVAYTWRKRPSVEKHLKEDEQIVINVLKQRDGQKIEQGTLRVVTGFSKASLSRLLSELEARKVVYKEKRGKKNLIWLKS